MPHQEFVEKDKSPGQNHIFWKGESLGPKLDRNSTACVTHPKKVENVNPRVKNLARIPWPELQIQNLLKGESLEPENHDLRYKSGIYWESESPGQKLRKKFMAWDTNPPLLTRWIPGIETGQEFYDLKYESWIYWEAESISF